MAVGLLESGEAAWPGKDQTGQAASPTIGRSFVGRFSNEMASRASGARGLCRFVVKLVMRSIIFDPVMTTLPPISACCATGTTSGSRLVKVVEHHELVGMRLTVASSETKYTPACDSRLGY